MFTKTLEDEFKGLTQREHVLLRPTVVGDVVPAESAIVWTLNNQNKAELAQIVFSKMMLKLFDEIIVNAADIKIDYAGMTELRVDVDKQAGTISVYNNGKCVRVEMHKDAKMYLPEFLFGNLLTSSNFDDECDEVRHRGGVNGIGAKLTNIWSKWFRIETNDTKQKLYYKQEFTDNMLHKSEPVITPSKEGSYAWTRITYKPDYDRFKSTLNDDIINLLKRRTYDMAGMFEKDLKVYWNGDRVPIAGFKQYMELYIPKPLLKEKEKEEDDMSDDNKEDKEEEAEEETKEQKKKKTPTSVYEKVNQHWQIGVALSPTGTFQQMTFANHIWTSNGGTHMQYILDQIVTAIREHIKKKFKGADVKPAQIKKHMFLFIHCLINKPTFASQSKAVLVTDPKLFGSTCILPQKLINRILKCGIVDKITSKLPLAIMKALQSLNGTKSARVSVDKLEDAEDAGGKNSADCYLILTEGDSAAALARAGVSQLGKKKYGLFPLKGKLINPQSAKASQVKNNQELANVMKILGLKAGVDYKDVSSLRYGHVMIMADQDKDGSHIKGLVMNLFAHLWPGLFKLKGFLSEIITPVVKAFKGKESLSFYTQIAYEEWKEANNGGKGWRIKYYKGLGTSDAREGKEYFSNLAKHHISFIHEGEKDDTAMDMAFRKKAVDRKLWLQSHNAENFMRQGMISEMTYTDFVYKELIHYALASNVRGIPSIMDGQKPGQRKILHCAFKKKVYEDMKVVSFGGYITENAAYHHGEMSLQKTIIGMAQNFVGSNNINLLHPSGQFGTHMAGGEDAGSARYIHTYLSTVARKIIRPEDDAILTYLEDDGVSVEPDYFLPIIPLILVNGVRGIGYGYSTYTPPYNPKDVIENLFRWMDGKELEPMHPWYNKFKGKVEQLSKQRYRTTGIISQTSPTTVSITQLPVGVWTRDYKSNVLDKMQSKSEVKTKKGKKEEPQEKDKEKQEKKDMSKIKDVAENHTDDYGRFNVTMTVQQMKDAHLCALGLDSITFVSDACLKLTTKESPKETLTALVEQKRIESFNQEKDDWTIVWTPEQKAKSDQLGLLTYFQLFSKTFSLGNMTLFDHTGKLKQYKTPEDILVEWAKVRAPSYDVRRQKMIDACKNELKIKGNRARFISAIVLEKTLDLRNMKRADVLSRLEQDGYDKLESTSKKSTGKNYDYLLNLSLLNLTLEKVEKLNAERDQKKLEMETIEKTSGKQMWRSDLQELVAEMKAFEEKEEELNRAAIKPMSHNNNNNKKEPTRKRRAKASTTSSSSSSGKAKRSKKTV